MDFKEVIKNYLDSRAASDKQFAVTYAKGNKSVEECCKYIIGEARKLGTEVCMSDDEVFGLAVHYYDEDNIEINDNKVMEVKVQRPEPRYPTPKQKPIKSKKTEFVQMSLF